MKRISLLVYEDAVLSALSGTLDILIGTNQFLQEKDQPAAFKVELVSETLKNIQLSLPVQFICHKTLGEVADTDLIVAPAFNGEADAVLAKNPALIDWIAQMHRRGVEIASLCYGSYFLAEAGLLAGKRCTSHWMTVEEMQETYPEANVVPDAVVTDQGGIYTSGGAFSSLNLLLYLVEKFCGREVSIHISKIFSIDMSRASQAHFAVFHGQRDHEDEEVLRAQDYIEQHYCDQISIKDVAEETSMSRRTFVRRFKKATKTTPLEYLQRVKVEAAKKALERSRENIGVLMYDVGYNDAKTFRQVFKRYTGLTPQAYRKKYSRTTLQDTL